MRKAQKRQAEELVRQMEEAHDQIIKSIAQGRISSAMELLTDCQNGGIALGTLIEQIEGEGHPTVLVLEEYCELIYQIHADLAGNKDINTDKIYKLLRRKLIKIENSIKNDIRVKLVAVFLPYKASMWDSLESVWKAADEDADCDAYVIPIPYYDRTLDRGFRDMHYEGDQYPDYVPITKYDEFDFEGHRPDMIYIHNPYDSYNLVTSVHPFFYTDNLKKFTDCLVYIPYYITAGGMNKAQDFIPPYMNIDYFVIQSPKIREYFDECIPDEKFLPFGSPKADRVIWKCQNPPTPPKEWQEKMAGRKVFFYNTSITGMLENTEDFVNKMQYVFDCFEERDDVCILWRPHPLLEATFQSLRPEYLSEFQKIQRQYIEEGIGIFDASVDIEDSIALSDAYIGDAGTSVTALFGVAGKPVFVLDNKILSKSDENSWREKVNFRFTYLAQNRFLITQNNELYVSKEEEYDYHYCCDLSDSLNGGEYCVIWQIAEKKYACPASVQNILRIGDEGIEKKICLKEEPVTGQPFIDAWKYDRFLVLLPLNYPAIVCFDTVSEELKYFEDNVCVFVKDKDGQKISGGSLVYHGSLYIASPVDNVVCRVDLESGETQIITIPVKSRCGCSGLVEYMDQIWMLPYEGKTIVRWDPQTGEIREYMEVPEGFACIKPKLNQECEELPFNSMAFYEDFVYLTPWRANMYLRLNIHTGKFEKWTPPFAKVEENKVTKSCFLQTHPENEKGWIKMFSNVNKKLYHIKLKTNECKELEIKFNMNDIYTHAHVQGFGKHSETLKYACAENIFNSLDRFIDERTMGSPFDKEKQLQAYGEVVVNNDGSCGRKTYEYIRAQCYR